MLSRFALAVVACLALADAATAQPQFSPEMTAAIKGCTFDAARANAIIKTQQELSEHVLKSPEGKSALSASMRQSPEERIAAMEKDAGSAAILKANGLSGRDYFTGLLALRAAAWAVDGRAAGLGALASPANIAFLKANPAIKTAFDEGEMGGMMPRRPRP